MNALEELRQQTQQASAGRTRVLVGLATCGIASGAKEVMAALQQAVEQAGLTQVDVIRTGCIGLCQYEPLVEVVSPTGEKVTYIMMNPAKAREMVESHLVGGKILEPYTICTAMKGQREDGLPIRSLNETDFYRKQYRIALKNCGVLDPENVDEYVAAGGYQALAQVLQSMTPNEVIQTVLDSGLRGRGGGGFPTGRKWQFARQNEAAEKYVCCNADEGDPGAFMDRSVLEGDPHVVLEAMAIAGYAIGARQGYIYVRAEYPIAVARLELALRQAREKGFLGQHIFGTEFSFEIGLRLGAGAFVCGEETALLTSIEGNRGEPRPRPPFPAKEGLFGKPTILNNVETFANIPAIITRGAAWFSAIGTEKSKGTKVFALGGKITNTGLVEIPMGTTLREIIDEIGGGVPNGKKFKAAQTGGPSGGCIPPEHFDIAIDYDNLIEIGSMMGSGGLIVMDEDNCMVDIAKFFLDFTVDESCGRCTPCRIGTKRMFELMERITGGKSEPEDLQKLEELSEYVKENALCGLGQTAPNPVLSTMRYFREEYVAHVIDKKCPAGVCRSLLSFLIRPDLCRGCTRCTKVCPADAIEGSLRNPHTILQDRCIKCGSCMDVCRFGAIEKM